MYDTLSTINTFFTMSSSSTTKKISVAPKVSNKAFNISKKAVEVVESDASSDEGEVDMFQAFVDMGMSPIVAKAMVEQQSKIVEQASAVEAFEQGKVAFGKSSGRDKIVEQMAALQSQLSSIDESVEGKKWLVAPRVGGGKSTASTAEQKDAKKARVIARKLKLAAGGGVKCEKCSKSFQAKNHFFVKHQAACVGKA